MDDLISEFVAEALEMVEALNSEIVAWEADPGDAERLNSIFRFVHTVKGNCGFFDFERLETLSHAAEDVLADMRQGRRQPDPQTVTAVLRIIDRISEIVEEIAATNKCPPGDDSRLIAALNGEVIDEEVAEHDGSLDSIAARPTASRTVRLPVDLLDRVMSGVSDVVLARNELTARINELGADHVVRGPFDRLSAMITEVRDSMTRTRMQPIETLFTSLPRMVRDLSGLLGKLVMVETDGGDVELDREMIEVIRDPILHLIRNSIDHGIELPDQRKAAGKREIGLIKISARQSGNKIIVEIADDGRGIDREKLVAKAVAAKVVTQAEAEAMDPHEQLMLMCEAGLSTAERVTEISGRGVGMDVVRANVEHIGGTLEIDSVFGKGLRILLQLPLTLSITPAVTVTVGKHRMAIPHSFCEEIVDSASSEIKFDRMGERWFAGVRGQRLPCVRLADLLGIDDSATARRSLIVLRLASGSQFVLAVDDVIAHHELVIKPVAPALMATGFYAGTTLSDEGLPTLLLDVTGIASAAGLDLGLDGRVQQREEARRQWEREENQIPLIVFTGLDDRRKAFRMAVVERIETVMAENITRTGGAWRVVLGGAIVPVAGLEDAEGLSGKVRLLRLNDGESVLAYACRQDSDVAHLPDEFKPAPEADEVEAIALIDGKPVEILDSHCLFARYGEAPQAITLPVCRLAADDRWAQNFLRPLIEAAGYRVIDEDDATHADIAICGAGEAARDLPAARHIMLRANEVADKQSKDTIYRYDREALVAALGAARKEMAA